MTDQATPRKLVKPIAACVALALLGGAVGEAFAADPGDAASPQRRAMEAALAKRAADLQAEQARAQRLPGQLVQPVLAGRARQPVEPRHAQQPAARVDARRVDMQRIHELAEPRLPKQPAQADGPAAHPARKVDMNRINALARPRANAPRPRAPIPDADQVLARQARAEQARTIERQNRLVEPVLGAKRGHDGAAPAFSAASTRSVEIPVARALDGASVHGSTQGAQRGFDAHLRLNAAQSAELARFAPLQEAADPQLQRVSADVPAPLTGPAAAYLLFDAAARTKNLTADQRLAATARIGALDFAPRAGTLQQAWRQLGLGLTVVDTADRDDDGLADAVAHALAQASEDGHGSVLRFEPAVAYAQLPDSDRIAAVVVRVHAGDGSTGYRVVYPNRQRGGADSVGFATLDTGAPGDQLNRGIVDLDPDAAADAFADDVAYAIYSWN